MSFDDALLGAIAKGRLPHGLLFSGLPGSGQAEQALRLAAMLFCRQKVSGKPCGGCGDCRLASQRSHPDLVWLAPEEKSRVVKVEQVRGMISRASLKPLQAPAKLFVIEPAECMNETAQNALLKTLEEPLGPTVIVLISHATEKLLPTVRSRVQEFRFTFEARPSSPQEVQDAGRLVIDQLLGKYGAAETPDLSEMSRDEISQVMEEALRDLREALLMRVGAESLASSFENRSRKEALAERLGPRELMEAIETVAEFKEKILQNVNTRLALAVLWEKLCPANII